MERLEVNAYYDFGDLRPGDRFIWEGASHVKISGNFADVILSDGTVIETVDMPEGAQVYLYELW